MVGFISTGGGGPDYIQAGEPQNPQNGEEWFDTDGGSDGNGELKIYDGDAEAWKITGFTSHGDLTGVTRDAHHPPVEVSAPLTQPSDQSLGLSIGDGLANSAGTLVAALGNGLGVDGDGQVYIPASAVSQSMLGFDTATQGELDTHAGDTSNPHNVTDNQTGAASALSDHAQDGNAHHSRYTDSEASAAAPVQTVNGQTGYVSVNPTHGTTIPSDPTSVRYGHPTAGTSDSTGWYSKSSWYGMAGLQVDVTDRAFIRFSAQITEYGDGEYTEVDIRWTLPNGSSATGGARPSDSGSDWKGVSGGPLEVINETGTINVDVEMRQTNRTGSGTLAYQSNVAEVSLNSEDIA